MIISQTDKLLWRNECVISKGDLELLHSFKNFPAFMGCSDRSADTDVKSDLNVYISKNTGILQINPLLPLEILYSESHNSGLTGKSWSKHHAELAKFISKFNVNCVLEIGGGHGTLAAEYSRITEVNNRNWIIIEPNPTPVDGCKAKIVKGFFDNKFSIDMQVDAVVHSHLFEHMYDPDRFVSDINNFLRVGNYIIFSVPNMQVMLDKKFTNCLNFEHTLLLSEPYIEYFLNKNNFKIVEKFYYGEDHSIFFCAVKTSHSIDLKVPDQYSDNKFLYGEYLSYHLLLCEKINKIATELDTIFMFGAHAQSQYLFSFGVNEKLICGILDNDKMKQNKRLCGTNLKVFDPKILANYANPAVVIRAGTFTKEIKEQILSINPQVNFIE